MASSPSGDQKRREPRASEASVFYTRESRGGMRGERSEVVWSQHPCHSISGLRDGRAHASVYRGRPSTRVLAGASSRVRSAVLGGSLQMNSFRKESALETSAVSFRENMSR